MTCYNLLFVYPDKERKSVAFNVFSSRPPSEWRMRWGPAWFDRRYVGSMLPLMPNMTDVGFKELEEGKYVLLDEGLCLYLAEKAPAWRRHLERLCGRMTGQVPLTSGLFDAIISI